MGGPIIHRDSVGIFGATGVAIDCDGLLRPTRMDARAPLFAMVLLAAGRLCFADGAGNVLPSIGSRAQREDLPRPTDLPSDAQLEAAQARIGKIIIDPRAIFDTTQPADDTRLFRLANRLHIRTRQQTIASQLLFRDGDPYKGRLLQESERILRNTRYLNDAWIRPIAYHDGLVDIEVVTRDVWTLNPGFNVGRAGGKTTSGFKVEELNLLGRGEQLRVGRKSEVDRDSTIFRFADPQLWGSWWGMDAQYSDNSDGKTQEFTLEHPFFSLDTRWAGGIDLKNDRRVDALYNLGEIADQYRVREKAFSTYLGFSRGLSNGWVRRWSAGFTVDDSQFSALPDPLISTFVPSNRKLQYPWLGFELLQDDYRTARNRDQIERTEDVPLGWRASVKLGFASPTFGADRSAVVMAAALGKGFDIGSHQSLMLDSSLGGRLESGSLTNALASFATRYYWKQSSRRLLYLGLSTDIGSDLDADKPLTLGGDSGLRGYPLRYQGGEGRWLFTIEQRLFSNWYPFRLANVGGAVFFDAGQAWGTAPVGTASKGMLKDVGVGLRLGNSRSALGNVIHLDLAFPLDGDSTIDRMQFLIETRRTF